MPLDEAVVLLEQHGHASVRALRCSEEDLTGAACVVTIRRRMNDFIVRSPLSVEPRGR